MTVGRDRWTDMLQVQASVLQDRPAAFCIFFFFCSVLILEYKALKIDSQFCTVLSERGSFHFREALPGY